MIVLLLLLLFRLDVSFLYSECAAVLAFVIKQIQIIHLTAIGMFVRRYDFQYSLASLAKIINMGGLCP